MEIHEFYRFEQLIYMELLDMIKNKFFIHECDNQKCRAYFASNNRHRKYCKVCSSKRQSSDDTYRNSLPTIAKTKTHYYNKYNYQIRKLDSDRKISAKKKLSEWSTAASKLLKKYKLEDRGDDVESFEKDLESLNFKF